MQATIDREKRRHVRQKILENISTIVARTDEAEKTTAEIRDHLYLHDRFFFQQQTNLTQDENYGTDAELNGLLEDTDQMIRQLDQANTRMKAACTFMHMYDYSTNPVFETYSSELAESL